MKKRNGNGQGSVFNVIRKVKRKNGFLKEECSICKSCKNKCNRELFEKCDKCIDCKEECLKYCDRFYCYSHYDAQVTINGKQTTIASSKKQKETTNKKLQVESKIQTKTYVEKNGITLIQKIETILQNKKSCGDIGENTYRKNLEDLKHIKESNIGYRKIQDLTYNEIQDFINTKTYMSQSCISSILQLIKMAFNQAVLDKQVEFADNPMFRVKEPFSEQEVKKIEAFDIDEEKQLIQYLLNTKKLIRNEKCQYDDLTIKNIILLGLFTGLRIGELGSLTISENIDFVNRILLVENTLTKDENSKVKMKSGTKAGKRKKKSKRKDFREIPFDLLTDESFIEKILKEQIEHAKKMKNNASNLLFCRLDGKYLEHTQITSLFKRICRDAKVKLQLEKGCFIHMTRHTFSTRCIEAGIDLMYLAELLGHSSTRQIEKTYGHLLTRYKQKNLEKLSSYYNEINILSLKELSSKIINVTIPKELYDIIKICMENDINTISYKEAFELLASMQKELQNI